MNISEEKLRELVIRAIERIEAEYSIKKAPVLKRRAYMICLKKWDERYPAFIKAAASAGQADICAVIPSEWKENGLEKLLKEAEGISRILTYEEAEHICLTERDLTIFPVVPRELVSKTALCISDNFETQWILSAMEQGSRIVFLKSGLRKLSGKESEAYTARILSYYRMVLEYGIEILGEINFSEELKQEQKPETKILSQALEKKEIRREEIVKEIQLHERKRKIITASDVERYQVDGVITMYPGDQITDVARDRAKFLKIALKRAESSC